MPISRIDAAFAKARDEHRTALITFTMAYDPSREVAATLLAQLPAAGADVIELGMAFSDPMADGKSIQAAGERALAAGATVRGTLAMVREFRTTNTTTPIILMGYLNPVEHYGYAAFAADAAAAGVDGFILVDLPPEEEHELRTHLDAHDLAVVRLIAPTTLGGRLQRVLQSAQGFVYTIAVAGITGDKSADEGLLASQIAAIRSHTALPIAAGFGIRTPEQARSIAKACQPDAVVVGSAIVDAAHANGPEAALALVRELHAALRSQSASTKQIATIS
jgi:tryptophan synthase alpha chain